jgi:hypothetical protein
MEVRLHDTHRKPIRFVKTAVLRRYHQVNDSSRALDLASSAQASPKEILNPEWEPQTQRQSLGQEAFVPRSRWAQDGLTGFQIPAALPSCPL